MEQNTIKTEVQSNKTQDATKDSGRVRLGGGAIHFSAPTPARAATKDAGRVHLGGGAVHF